MNLQELKSKTPSELISKAEKLGVLVLSEQDFLDKLK